MSGLDGLERSSSPAIFEIQKAAGGSSGETQMNSARLGRLAIAGRKVIQTPNFLAISSRGVIPHLTPDVISAHTDICGIHTALEDYIERAATNTPPILKCPAGNDSPLHKFAALPSPLVTLLSPRRTPAIKNPGGNTSTDDGISIYSSIGFQKLSVSAYSNYVHSLKPDMVIGLGDVPYGTRPGAKRLLKMADRTSSWLDALVEKIRSSLSPFDGKSPAIFAPVLPIDYHVQSDYLNHIADDLVDSISGLAIYSSDILPEIPATTSVSRLVRLSLDEPTSPQQILQEVSLGMDLFAIPFIGFTSDAGLAFTFQFPPPSHASQSPKPLAIDLSDPAHSSSLTPLVPGCTCYTCTSHHRAFIQHLLSAREMLAWVLLQVHNLHIMSNFFTSIREAIEAGNFEEKRAVFERHYESELPEGTGQKPRARCYQFKSDGPGEVKRNKPAWGTLGESNVNGSEEVLIPDDDSKHLQEKGFAEKIE